MRGRFHGGSRAASVTGAIVSFPQQNGATMSNMSAPYRHQAPAQPRCLHQRCCSQQRTQPHHVLPHAPHFSLACSAERRHVTYRSRAGACDCRQAAAAAPSAAVGHHPVTAAAHVARQGPGSYFFWRSFVLPCSFVWAGAKSCAPQRSRHTKSQKKIYGCAQSRRARGSTIGRPLLEYTSALAAGSSCSMAALLVFSCFLLAISATAAR